MAVRRGPGSRQKQSKGGRPRGCASARETWSKASSGVITSSIWWRCCRTGATMVRYAVSQVFG